jgi:hypothetical protein
LSFQVAVQDQEERDLENWGGELPTEARPQKKSKYDDGTNATPAPLPLPLPLPPLALTATGRERITYKWKTSAADHSSAERAALVERLNSILIDNRIGTFDLCAYLGIATDQLYRWRTGKVFKGDIDHQITQWLEGGPRKFDPAQPLVSSSSSETAGVKRPRDDAGPSAGRTPTGDGHLVGTVVHKLFPAHGWQDGTVQSWDDGGNGLYSVTYDGIGMEETVAEDVAVKFNEKWAALQNREDAQYEDDAPVDGAALRERWGSTMGVATSIAMLFQADVESLWSNCQKYNQPGSEIYDDAGQVLPSFLPSFRPSVPFLPFLPSFLRYFLPLLPFFLSSLTFLPSFRSFLPFRSFRYFLMLLPSVTSFLPSLTFLRSFLPSFRSFLPFPSVRSGPSAVPSVTSFRYFLPFLPSFLPSLTFLRSVPSFITLFPSFLNLSSFLP